MREILKGEDRLGDPQKKKRKIIFSQPGEGWYNNEDFATKAVPKHGWGLVTKSVLPESRNKNWEDQQKALEKWAKDNDIDPKTIRRRTPVEIAYDTFINYGGNKESLLEDSYDWTGVQSSGGRFVFVGYFDSGGLYVGHDGPGGRDRLLGVCPAR